MESLVVGIGFFVFVLFILPIVSIVKVSNLRNEYNRLKTDLTSEIEELQRTIKKLENNQPSQNTLATDSSQADQQEAVVESLTVQPNIESTESATIQPVSIDSDVAVISQQADEQSSQTENAVVASTQDANNDAPAEDANHQLAANEVIAQEEVNDPWSQPSKASNTRKATVKNYVRKESKVAKYLTLGMQWIKEINVFVSVGILVLFIGTSFLIRHAVENNMFPIQYRLAGILVVAIALLYWGWRFRDKKKVFAMALQGGGIAIIYLDVFASFSLFHLIDSLVAFALLALLVVLGVLLALSQNAISLAIISIAGGFAAPILTSDGGNNFVGLFSYYSILNAGIFFIAWHKAWRALNMLGFVFTFSISAMWGASSYAVEHYVPTQLFLALFVLMYLFIGVLFALKRQHFYKDYVDSSLIFGTPLIGFSLQIAIVNTFEYGISLSALCFGAAYIIAAQLLWSKYGQKLRMLVESLLIIGVLFLTLSIPFAVDGAYTAAIWAIEAAGIMWLSVKQLQKNRRLFAAVLAAISPFMAVYQYFSMPAVIDSSASNAFANSFFISVLLITIALSFISYFLQKEYDDKRAFEAPLSLFFLGYGIGCLLLGFVSQIIHFNIHQALSFYLMILGIAGVISYGAAAIRLRWTAAIVASTLFILPLPVAVLFYPLEFMASLKPEYIALLVSYIISSFLILNTQQLNAIAHSKWVSILGHITVALSIFYLLASTALWLLLFVYTVFSALCNFVGNRFNKQSLNYVSLSLLPVLIYCSAYAVGLENDLVNISYVGDYLVYPFAISSGIVLWPLAFCCYFYLLNGNRKIGTFNTQWLLYASTLLVVGLCLYLATWLFMIVALASALLCTLLSERAQWPQLRMVSLALAPALMVMITTQLLLSSSDLLLFPGLNLEALFVNQWLGAGLWLLALSVLYFTLFIYEKLNKRAHHSIENVALLIVYFVITWQGSWQLFDNQSWLGSWHISYIALISLAFIGLITKVNSWPFKVNIASYNKLTLPILHTVLIVFALFTTRLSGEISPLHGIQMPWIAILNPMTIMVLLSVIALFRFITQSQIHYIQKYSSMSLILLAAFSFLYANLEIMRAVHFYNGLPWEATTLISSDITQTAFSIFWSVTGLLGAVYASRQQKRKLWIVSGALLAIVVLKLFVVDMAASNTVERIVSFIGVGLLLVVIGYFSPLPPKANNTDESELDDEIDDEVEGRKLSVTSSIQGPQQDNMADEKTENKKDI